MAGLKFEDRVLCQICCITHISQAGFIYTSCTMAFFNDLGKFQKCVQFSVQCSEMWSQLTAKYFLYTISIFEFNLKKYVQIVLLSFSSF